jgi:hypothetical protein
MRSNERRALQSQGDRVGTGDISDRSRQALADRAPSANDILANMGGLNEEITDAWSGYVTPGVKEFFDENDVEYEEGEEPVEEYVAPKDSLQDDDFEAELDRNLREMKAKALAERDAKLAEERAKAKESKTKQEPEATPEAESPEETMRDRVLEKLYSMPGAPTPNNIASWKRQYGDDNVNVIAFGDEDVYVFVPLSRSQWQNIQSTAQAAAGTSAAPTQEKLQEMMMESVIKYAVKWPASVRSVEFAHASKAGVIPTLHEVIMLHSYFLNPAQAMMLTTKL